MGIDVFISYSTKDSNDAYTVKNVLETNGISCWIAPESIPGGSNYTKSIPKAISDCKIFILILSSNAQKSLWVPAELEHAYKQAKIIIPFDVENCSLNSDFDFLISRSQRLNAYEKKSEALQKLTNIIKSIIGADDKQAKNIVQRNSNELDASTEKKTVEALVCPHCKSEDISLITNKLIKNVTMGTAILTVPTIALPILGVKKLLGGAEKTKVKSEEKYKCNACGHTW